MIQSLGATYRRMRSSDIVVSVSFVLSTIFLLLLVVVYILESNRSRDIEITFASVRLQNLIYRNV